MTAAAAEASRTAPAAPRLGFARRLIVVEAALTVAEAILVIGPTLALAAKSLRASGESFRVGALLGALMIVGWVRAADLLRPLLAARDAKRAGLALDDAEARGL